MKEHTRETRQNRIIWIRPEHHDHLPGPRPRPCHKPRPQRVPSQAYPCLVIPTIREVQCVH